MLVTLFAHQIDRARVILADAHAIDVRHALKAGLTPPDAPILTIVSETTAYVCGNCRAESGLMPDSGITACCGAFARARAGIQVEVTAGRPTIGDWELLAVVEPQDDDCQRQASPNLIRTVPGASIPDDAYADFQAEDATRCDHCMMSRRRSETFMVRSVTDPDTIHLVGRNCLSAFLGGQSYEMLVRRLTWVSQLSDLSSDEGGGWGRGGYPSPTIQEVLHLTAVSVRVDGWRSRAVAQERNTQSTSDHVRYLCNPPMSPIAREAWHRECKRLAPQPGDLARAESALAWVRETLVPSSDFDHSIRTVGRLTHVEQYGLVCAIFPTWQRAPGESTRRATRAPTTYLGDPKGRRTGKGAKAKMAGTNESITGTIEVMRAISSQFGTSTKIVVRSDSGDHVVEWWKSGEVGSELNVGDSVTITGTVKRHEEGRYELTGDKVTVLTRCTIRVVDEEPPELAEPENPAMVCSYDEGDAPF